MFKINHVPVKQVFSKIIIYKLDIFLPIPNQMSGLIEPPVVTMTGVTGGNGPKVGTILLLNKLAKEM